MVRAFYSKDVVFSYVSFLSSQKFPLAGEDARAPARRSANDVLWILGGFRHKRSKKRIRLD